MATFMPPRHEGRQRTRRTGRLEVAEGVGRSAVDAHLEVEVVAVAVPGAADVADDLALVDALPGADYEGGLMRITGLQAAAVFEAGEVAVAAAFDFPLEQDHVSRGGGADRRPG